MGNAFTRWAWSKVAPVHNALSAQAESKAPELESAKRANGAVPLAPMSEHAAAQRTPTAAEVPVLINSFNQPTYLRKMIEQLRAVEHGEIVVLDQCSTYPPLLDYLSEIEREVTVVRLRDNNGPHWLFTSGLSLTLPEFFVYTDPDILFPPDMPPTLIGDLMRAATFLQATKVGLALDISRPSDMKRANISIGGAEYSFAGWEQQFWERPLSLDDLELYRAPVDTTFALYSRARFDALAREFKRQQAFDCMDTPDSFRLGGRYTSVHLPWMVDDLLPREEFEFFVGSRKNFHQYLDR